MSKDTFTRNAERATAAHMLRSHLNGCDRLTSKYLDREVLPKLTKRQILEIALDLDWLRTTPYPED